MEKVAEEPARAVVDNDVLRVNRSAKPLAMLPGDPLPELGQPGREHQAVLVRGKECLGHGPGNRLGRRKLAFPQREPDDVVVPAVVLVGHLIEDEHQEAMLAPVEVPAELDAGRGLRCCHGPSPITFCPHPPAPGAASRAPQDTRARRCCTQVSGESPRTASRSSGCLPAPHSALAMAEDVSSMSKGFTV